MKGSLSRPDGRPAGEDTNDTEGEDTMRRYGLFALGAAVLAVSAAGLSVQSEGPKSDDPASLEFREKFLKDFRRTGLATTVGDALFLRILVEARGAKRGIEVGTEMGFGAINMGIGFERNGGRLYTLEIDPRLVKISRENIAKVALDKTVTVVEGDALKTLPTLEGEFDFMFIDAAKSDYFKYFKAVEAKLKPGAVICADNAIQSARAMKDFLDYMKDSPNYEMVIIRASMDKGDGMAVCYKIK